MAGFNPLHLLGVLELGQTLLGNDAKDRSSELKAQADAKRYENDRAQMELARKAEEKRAQENLKRNQAARRARFGAQGVGSKDGSAAAVLSGLRKQSQSELEATLASDDLALSGLDERYDATRRRNLLEQSDQRNRATLDVLRKGVSTVSLLNR